MRKSKILRMVIFVLARVEINGDTDRAIRNIERIIAAEYDIAAGGQGMKEIDKIIKSKEWKAIQKILKLTDK